MAMRKICPRCGRINSVTAWECEYCKGDIESEKSTNIPAPNHKKLFCDPETREYLDTPPVDLERLEAESKKAEEESIEDSTATIKEEEASIEDSDTIEIKTCPVCERINKATETECPCGKSLKRVAATSVPIGSVTTWDEDAKSREKEETKEKKAPKITFEEAISDATREYEEEEGDSKYYILIGAGKDENRINVNFVDGVFKIGAYYQKCLYDKMYVSGEHCFLKERDGKIYLYESEEKPSKNGTYLRKSEGARERIIPGKEYPLEIGSIFYACNVIIAVLKHL